MRLFVDLELSTMPDLSRTASNNTATLWNTTGFNVLRVSYGDSHSLKLAKCTVLICRH